MSKPTKSRVGDFLAGKGFYIVLFLCIAAIGISGYYLFSSVSSNDEVTVNAPVEVVVAQEHSVPPATDSVTPEMPSIATPKPSSTVKASGNAVVAEDAAAEPAADPVFIYPVSGEVVNTFRMDELAYDATMGDWRTHAGLDISASLGTQVMAAAAGTVVEIDQDDFFGTTVILEHTNGLRTTYANLAAEPTVVVGDTVSTGDILGAVGATAIAESAEAPHLHFELTRDGQLLDPTSFLPER